MSRVDPEDDNVFREQLVALLPRLRRFALSLTSDINEADDLVQAACERALSRRHQFKDGSRVDSWMFSIIHHLLIDETRAMRRKKSHVPFEEGRFLATAINGMKKLEAKLQLQTVYAAMQKLTDNDRLVISLVCIDGMSYKDAAQTMQVPVGTVMSRLARARKKLHGLVRQRQGSSE
jgi:RNA polymerase sigma-70 factor (ECF subfamily)